MSQDDQPILYHAPLPFDIVNGLQEPDPYCGYAPPEHTIAANNVQISQDDYLCIGHFGDAKHIYDNMYKYKDHFIKLDNCKTYQDLLIVFLYHCLTDKFAWKDDNEIHIENQTLIENTRVFKEIGGTRNFKGFYRYKTIWTPAFNL